MRRWVEIEGMFVMCGGGDGDGGGGGYDFIRKMEEERGGEKGGEL